MRKDSGNLYRREFDYEEDDYDRLKRVKKQDYFTNKSKLKKLEFDYEEDAYEPLRRR
ncbi:hypothetical protein QBE52_17730 [Clostridiaceae bacterium 35-E11]